MNVKEDIVLSFGKFSPTVLTVFLLVLLLMKKIICMHGGLSPDMNNLE